MVCKKCTWLCKLIIGESWLKDPSRDKSEALNPNLHNRQDQAVITRAQALVLEPIQSRELSSFCKLPRHQVRGGGQGSSSISPAIRRGWYPKGQLIGAHSAEMEGAELEADNFSPDDVENAQYEPSSRCWPWRDVLVSIRSSSNPTMSSVI